MIMIRKSLLVLVLFISVAGIQQVTAAIIVDSLGNPTPGFNNGDVPDTATVGGAQGGQVDPFNQSLGNDILADTNATGSWSHIFDLMGKPIQSAILDFGIVDHDSAASGDQVSLFSIDGVDLTTELNALFEASGGGDNEYNVYQLDLGSILGNLADGSADFILSLTGPGQQTCLAAICSDPSNPVTETISNGANYIFSALTITTQDSPPPNPAPEPGTLLLFSIGILGMRTCRQRYLAQQIPKKSIINL